MSRRQEWRRVLEAELKRWSALACEQLIAELRGGRAYEVEFDSRHYQVEVQLLENTDEYVHVIVGVDDGSLPASLMPLTASFTRRKHESGGAPAG